MCAVWSTLRWGGVAYQSRRYGEWESMRGYARHGYDYGRGRSGATNASASSYYSGSAGTSAGAAAGGLADRAAQGLDNLKDRVDGNPASKPGPDATDRMI